MQPRKQHSKSYINNEHTYNDNISDIANENNDTFPTSQISQTSGKQDKICVERENEKIRSQPHGQSGIT